MIDCATLCFDDFMQYLESHRFLYLKGSNRRVYLKRSYDDSFILGDTTGGFVNVGEFYSPSPLDDRLLYFFTKDHMISFQINRIKWELDE